MKKTASFVSACILRFHMLWCLDIGIFFSRTCLSKHFIKKWELKTAIQAAEATEHTQTHALT